MAYCDFAAVEKEGEGDVSREGKEREDVNVGGVVGVEGGDDGGWRGLTLQLLMDGNGVAGEEG